MGNVELVAGSQTYLLYGVETTYGTAAGTVTSIFGIVTKFTPTGNRNVTKRYGFAGSDGGGRTAQKLVPGKYESSFSVELEPQFWDWLQYVLGTRSGAGTAGSPYVYVAAASPSSLTVSHNLNNSTTDREERYLGCMVNSITIRAAVGEPVSVTVDFISADMDKDAALTANVAVNTGDPYIFAGGSIEVPDGAALTNIIDSVEITINCNAEIRYGLGDYIGKRGVAKGLDYSIKWTMDYLNETMIENFLGNSASVAAPTEIATMAVKFTNGATKYIDFVFTDVRADQYAEDATVNEVLTEDITCTARSLSISEVQTA